jgi:radical SAM superfamily enzyme YgiQ (UPF0313 family)
MKVALIIPQMDNRIRNLPIYSSTLPVLASICMKYPRCDIQQIDMNLTGDTVESIVRRICSCECDVVGISPSAFSIMSAIAIAEGIKRRRPISTVIFGGNYITQIGAYIHEAIPCLDYSVHGHAFHSLPVLLSTIESGKIELIPGVIHRTQACGSVDLATLSFDESDDPFTQFVYDDTLLNVPGVIPSYISSYGCMRSCTFCSEMRTIYHFPLPAIAAAIKHLQRAKFRFVWNTCTTFFHENMSDYCDYLLQRNCCLPFYAMAHVDDFLALHDRTLEKLKQIGLQSLLFGVETASFSIKRRIRKMIDNDMALEGVRKAKSLGIDAVISFIMYFPFSTWDDIASNIKFLRRIVDMDIFLPFEFIHSEVAVYPGTSLAKDLHDTGLLTETKSLGPLTVSYEDQSIEKLANEMRRYQAIFNPIDIRINSIRQMCEGEGERIASLSRIYLDLTEEVCSLAQSDRYDDIEKLVNAAVTKVRGIAQGILNVG